MISVDKNSNLELFQALNFSCETYDRMQRYAVLLSEWNEKFNLVAASSLPDMWRRHFLDSAQLYQFVHEKAYIGVDLGSGSGFPGLILGIVGTLKMHLIESVGKKVNFLNAVVEDLGLKNVTVHHGRIEEIRGIQADVVTARALKPLPELLSLAKPFCGAATECLFLKGRQVDAELTEAAKYWTFDCEKFQSASDESGTILKIKNIKIIRKNERRKFRNGK